MNAEIIINYEIDEHDDLVNKAHQLIIQLILKRMVEQKQYTYFEKIKLQLQHQQQNNIMIQNLLRQLEQNQLQFVD